MESVHINTVSAVDAVRNALEADILNLRFAPGAKITEGDLVARYGISRNTIREAVAHLLSQGLLTKVANKGVYVRRFTVDDVQEIFHLRAMLESEAVRSLDPTQELLSKLYHIASEMETMGRVDQWHDYVQADIQFHSMLVSAAHSPRLDRLYNTILTEVKLCIYQTRNYVQLKDSNSVSHRQILDAIACGSKEIAITLLRSHIEHVIKRYCAGLIAMDGNL